MLQHQADFIQWFYGGAIILDGLSRIDDVFHLDHSQVMDGYLDAYANNPEAYGYKILHNIVVPWYHNVGDQIGLFPINYLNRILRKTGTPGYNNTTDATIVSRVITQYLIKFPHRLGDGTFGRKYGWPAEPAGTDTFLWSDDMYMGLTLIARAAALSKDENLAQFTALQVVAFVRYLQDPVDGLLTHGANAASQHRSCCKWGRSNGWALMAQVEVLAAMQGLPRLQGSLEYRELVAYLQWQVEGLVRYQVAGDGRWRQVVNESSTFLETSGSAMFVSALSRAAMHGWVSADMLAPTLRLAWEGLNRVISQNGTISGVCNGLGKYIFTNPSISAENVICAAFSHWSSPPCIDQSLLIGTSALGPNQGAIPLRN